MKMSYWLNFILTGDALNCAFPNVPSCDLSYLGTSGKFQMSHYSEWRFSCRVSWNGVLHNVHSCCLVCIHNQFVVFASYMRSATSWSQLKDIHWTQIGNNKKRDVSECTLRHTLKVTQFSQLPTCSRPSLITKNRSSVNRPCSHCNQGWKMSAMSQIFTN